MSFGVLALIVAAGLAGPLISSAQRIFLPLAVGEIFAGIVIGRTGMGWLNADEPTVKVLGDIGFAMLMFAAGMHVPVRTPGLARTVKRATTGVVVAAALAVPAGFLAARAAGDSHAAVYALSLAGGSAAIALPAMIERRLLSHRSALTVITQIAIADVIAIVAVPLVLEPERALRAAIASLAVSVMAFVVYVIARTMDQGVAVRLLRQRSATRGWALDLRLALLILFVLGWVAVRGGSSILVAGFGVGLVVSALGGPSRLSTQVTGIAEGFFVPLFFVVLGARIDLSALWSTPRLLGLVAVLVATNVVVHLAAARASGQHRATGLITTAQLGLPAAIASLGLSSGVLTPGTAAAIVAAGLASLPIAAGGVTMFARHLARRGNRKEPGLPSISNPPRRSG